MKDPLLKIVKDFLASHLKGRGPLLLGLSGGPDSLALFYLLMQCPLPPSFPLHLAHVDHGWRRESREEAKVLEEMAKKFALPFHLKQLAELGKENLEEKCRDERRKFFLELHHKHRYQALLLAHQGDDQAETVLKRIFEGAGFRGLGGIQPVNSFEDLPIWRPLLKVEKKKIKAWLEKNKLQAFEDPTNVDPHFLRGRLRNEIFPFLEGQFGKNIKHNLLSFADLFQRISYYFEKKEQLIEKKMSKGPFGSYLNLAELSELDPLVWDFFWSKWAITEKARFSREAKELLLHFIKENSPCHQVAAPPYLFCINTFHLFVIKKEFPLFSWGKWELLEEGKKGGWLPFFLGKIPLFPTKGALISYVALDRKGRNRVKKHYQKRKVPPFLHEKAPLIVGEKNELYEMLSGQLTKVV